MNALVAGLGAFLFLFGAFVVVVGARSSSSRIVSKPLNLPKISVRAGGVLALSALFALVSGWLPALIVGPGVGLVLPDLLRPKPNREVQLLAALDRWVRLLTASVATGKSIPDAMRTTYAQCPKMLKSGVSTALARLRGRWSVRESLLALADEWDSTDADAVLAACILCSERGGLGAHRTLDALADSVSDRLAALREIDAERAKPRVVVRQVTMITVVVLGAGVVINPSYFAPFTIPIGQVLAIGFFVCYMLSLRMLQRMSRPQKRERILQVNQ